MSVARIARALLEERRSNLASVRLAAFGQPYTSRYLPSHQADSAAPDIQVEWFVQELQLLATFACKHPVTDDSNKVDSSIAMTIVVVDK